MRTRCWTVAAIALALLAGACGGDAEADGEQGSEGVEEAEGAAAEPEGEEPAESPAEVRYEVEAGDTLSRIADDFGVSVSDLVEANDLEDPDVLMQGQELVIPAPYRADGS